MRTPRLSALTLSLAAALLTPLVHAASWAPMATISGTATLVTNSLCYTDGRDIVCDGTGPATGTASGDRITSGTTGMYAYNNTSASIATAGVERLIVGSDGKIGIGAQPSWSKLGVSGSVLTYGASGGLYIADQLNSVSNSAIYRTGNITRFYDNTGGGADRMAIDNSTGNVGIGTTNPTSTLDVSGNIALSGLNQSGLIYTPPSSGYHQGGIGISTNRHNPPNQRYFTFGNDGNFYVNNGFAGIFLNATPSTTLHVGGSIRLGTESSTTLQTCDANRLGAIKYASGDFSYCRNGTSWESLTSLTGGGGSASDRITSGTLAQVIAQTAGTVQISATATYINNGGANSAILKIGTNPTANRYAYLDLVGDSTYPTGGLRLIRGDTGANTDSSLLHRGTGSLNISTQDSAPIAFNTSSSEAMRITSAGLVGIGTLSPTAKLEVAGTISATALTVNGVAITGSGGGASDRITSSTTSAVIANQSGTVNFTLGSTAGAAYLHPTLGLVGPGVSVTGAISATNGYIGNKLSFGSGAAGITTAGTKLTLEQTGDIYGATRLSLLNRDGSNGAIFESPALDLVDFGFLPSTGAGSQNNIRLEHRNGQRLTENTNGEFQLIHPQSLAIWMRLGPNKSIINGTEFTTNQISTTTLYVNGVQITGSGGGGSTDRITSGTTQVIARNNTSASIITNNLERMTIGTNGNVSMTGNLLVGNAPSWMDSQTNSVYAKNFYSGEDVVVNEGQFLAWGDGSSNLRGFSNGSDRITFNVDSIERMVVNSSGNVGIGIVTPTTKLEVAGTISTSALYVNGVQITTNGGGGGGGATDRITSGTTSVITRQNGPVTISATNLNIGTYDQSNAPDSLYIGLETGLTRTSYTTALGHYAAANNTGLQVTAIGYNAAYENTGNRVTALGQEAAIFNTAIYVTALGEGAAYNNTGTRLTAVGESAAANNAGANLTAIGEAAAANNTGNDITAIGSSAAESNQGYNVTAVGLYAAQNSTGSSVVTVGEYSSSENTGSDVVAMGYYAAYLNQGYSVVAIGNSAAGNNQGNETTAVGHQAGRYNQAEGLTAVGAHAAGNVTSGANNTAVGANAMQFNTIGSDNTLLGYGAGLGVDTNSYSRNTLLGAHVGYSLTTGSSNTLVGYNVGSGITTGSNNILIGSNVGPFSNTGSNQLNIGNAIWGDIGLGLGYNTKIGINNNSPTVALEVSGSIVSKVVNKASATSFNWAAGNVQYTSANCGAMTFTNMVDGGAYTLVVKGATSGTCSFTHTGLTVHMPTDHGATTASKHTVYSFLRAGTDLYVSWVKGL